jgi:SAM-dependent methyltransferase
MSGTLRPSIALCAYAEPLLEGRRVVVFGDSSSALAQQLLERGARIVHVYDPDVSRVAEAATRNRSRSVSIAPLPEGTLAVRDGAFDVGLVEDLTLTGPVHSVVKRLRRALSPRGVALVAAPNPEAVTRLLPARKIIDGALDYYQLYDAVAAEFHHVRMLGQTPFVGFAIVDFAAGAAPEPSLDTAFVTGGAEEPEWFIALASDMPLHLDEFAVVQLPMSALALGERDTALEQELARAREAERRARERMAELEATLGEQGHRLRAQEPKQADPAELAALRAELARRDKWIVELEARASVADARADEAQAELDATRAELADQDRLRAELDALRRRVAEQEQRIALLTAVETPSGPDELGNLEDQLAERGATLRRLESELRATESLGRELLAEMERLAEAVAEREADLQAARWSLQSAQGFDDPDEARSSLAEARGELQRGAVFLWQAAHRPRPS